MKRIITLVLLGSFVAVLAQTASAQSRPRRVGQTQTPQQTQSQTQPSSDDSQPARSSRPPVLSGGNRDPNEQQPSSTSPQKAGPEEVSEGDIVRVNTTLVSIPVSVTDRDGKNIPNLRKENFRIWEDGVEQQVAYFASTEKPFTVALMVDTSGSMRFKMNEIQDAAIAFVDQLRPDDRVMLISFDDRIRVWSEPTNDHAALRNYIRQLRQGSGTRLYDAVDQVIKQHLNRIEGRKAIVLFTDGVDTTSKHAHYEDTVSEAEEVDALIYPVEFDTYSDMAGRWPGGGGGRGGYPGGGGSPSGRSGGGIGGILGSIIFGGGYPGGGGGYPGGRGGGGWPRGNGGPGSGTTPEEYERGERYLNDLARVSGARLYDAEKQDLNYAFQMVAEELRRQYSLGYYPKRSPQPGERRSIKVRVDRPELAVRARDSYVFQPGANNTAQGQTNSQPKPPVLKKELIGGRF